MTLFVISAILFGTSIVGGIFGGDRLGTGARAFLGILSIVAFILLVLGILTA